MSHKIIIRTLAATFAFVVLGPVAATTTRQSVALEAPSAMTVRTNNSAALIGNKACNPKIPECQFKVY